MRPGDNKWSITIWARNPETGMAKWAYQIEPHDGFDYDEIMENVLVDMPWHGHDAQAAHSSRDARGSCSSWIARRESSSLRKNSSL